MSTPVPTPTDQPDPPTVPAPTETPPAPAAPPAPAPETAEARASRAEAALQAERDRAKGLERELGKAKQASMSDADKQLAKARDEGKAEARREAGLAVAAAEFRAAATGRLTDPSAALEALDLAKFVGDDGQVDSKGIGKLVERLTAALPAPSSPGRVPAGPHGAPANDDFLRSGITAGGGFR